MADGALAFGVVLISSSTLAVVILGVLYFYYMNKDKTSKTNSPPTSTTTTASSKKSTIPAARQTTSIIPIKKKVVIYSDACIAGKSVLTNITTPSEQSGWGTKGLKLWCRVDGIAGGAIWQVEKAHGNGGFYYIRNVQTRDLLTAWPDITFAYLQGRSQKDIKSQQWKIAKGPGGKGFVISNRLLSERGQYSILDANAQGCLDGDGKKPNTITFRNQITSSQIWNIIKVTENTDVSAFTNLNQCDGSFALIGPGGGSYEKGYGAVPFAPQTPTKGKPTPPPVRIR
jgi:hypothetical protein